MFKVSKNLGKVPEDCRVYVIGDIHGCADLLLKLLDSIIKDKKEAKDVERNFLIFLGDYIDRGIDSKKTIDIMLTDIPDGFEVITLKGNHEEMMLDAMEHKEALPTWIHNGGQATLYSYGINPENYMLREDATLLLGTLLAAQMPTNHKKFFESLQLKADIGDYFFVHAGVNPNFSLKDQKERDLLWIRRRFLQHTGKFEKIIVHGHTPVEKPEVHANRIGIDTGAWTTGCLTALCLEDSRYRFIST